MYFGYVRLIFYKICFILNKFPSKAREKKSFALSSGILYYRQYIQMCLFIFFYSKEKKGFVTSPLGINIKNIIVLSGTHEFHVYVNLVYKSFQYTFTQKFNI